MKMNKKRGVVIGGACDITKRDGKDIFQVADFDSTLINASLLYWDRIDIPDSTFVSVMLPPEMALLEQEGILSRKKIPFGDGMFGVAELGNGAILGLVNVEIGGQKINVPEIVNKAPQQAFKELLSDKETLWAYFQNSPTILTSDIPKLLERSLLFEIHNALPIPNADTPYEKILEFKNKRASELQELRFEMEESYQRVINSKDIEHAKSLEFAKLAKTLSDLDKVTQEDLIGNIKRSIKIPTTVEGICDLATAGILAASGGSITTGIIKLAVATVKYVDVSELIKTSKIPENLVPYQYLLDAKKEIGLKLAS